MKCGTHLSELNKFCTSCGHPLPTVLLPQKPKEQEIHIHKLTDVKILIGIFIAIIVISLTIDLFHLYPSSDYDITLGTKEVKNSETLEVTGERFVINKSIYFTVEAYEENFDTNLLTIVISKVEGDVKTSVLNFDEYVDKEDGILLDSFYLIETGEYEFSILKDGETMGTERFTLK